VNNFIDVPRDSAHAAECKRCAADGSANSVQLVVSCVFESMSEVAALQSAG
jgi:hypothetical protein